MARQTFKATLVFKRAYESYFQYRTIEKYIYKFEDEQGNVYVWFTSVIAQFKGTEGRCPEDYVRVGDSFTMTATVGEEEDTQYGKQRKISRPVFTAKQYPAYIKPVITLVEQGEEFTGDILHISYRAYKQHYSDCVAYGYDETTRTIKVVVPAGRLVKSGVRGERLYRMFFMLEDGRVAYARGFQEQATIKRVEKCAGCKVVEMIEEDEFSKYIADGRDYIPI